MTHPHRLRPTLIAPILLALLLAAVANAQTVKTRPAQDRPGAVRAESDKTLVNDVASPVAGKLAATYQAIPGDPLGFALIRDLSAIDAKLAAVVKHLQMPIPSALETLQAQTGISEGFDKNGTAIIALYAGKEGESPLPIIMIPVADFAKFAQNFGDSKEEDGIREVSPAGTESLLAKHGAFAVFGPPSQKDRFKATLAAKGNAKIALPADWVAKQDAVVIVLPQGVKTLTALGRAGIAQIKQGMQAAPVPKEQLDAMLAGFELYDQLFTAADKEVSHMAAGFQISDDGGLALNSAVRFSAEGDWSKASAELGARANPGFTALPSGPFLMAFDGVMSKQFAEKMMAFSVQSMQNMAQAAGHPLSADKAKELTTAMRQMMDDVQSMSMLVSPPKPGQSLYDGMLGVMRTADASKFLANYEKGAQATNEVLKQINNPLMAPYEIKRGDVGGIKTVEFSMDMSAMFEQMGNNPATKPMMQLMFGESSKITAYLADADKNTIVMGYSREAFRRAHELVRTKGETLNGDADVAKTIELLPGKAQFLALVSPRGLVDMIRTVIQAAVPPGAIPPLPEFPDTPPVGFAAQMGGQGVQTTLVVPSQVLEGIGDYIQLVQQTMRNLQQ